MSQLSWVVLCASSVFAAGHVLLCNVCYFGCFICFLPYLWVTLLHLLLLFYQKAKYREGKKNTKNLHKQTRPVSV